MSKTLDLKYYKIELNDESKETKCTQIIICEIPSPSKKKNIVWIFETNIDFFLKIERNHKVQYDYDNKLSLPK
jgi:hypothetical protein